MRLSIKTGLSFGLTSGTITTLGLIVGLDASTHSQLAVIGGILTIAIADSFSDALGVHVSQESQNQHSAKSIWESTIATFLSKLIFASTFIVPILLLELSTAIIMDIVWGFLILGIFSFLIAKQNKENPKQVIMEHLTIGAIVVLITYFVGNWISSFFG
jgi:vacuolar iron transporter family protein